MGIKVFKILFNNPVKTYTPGEIVAGRIFLELDSQKKCRGIQIRLKGEALAFWVQSAVNGNTQFRSHEKYFSTKFFLVGGKSEEIILDSKKHVFPFEYVLPLNIPSSYELKTSTNQAYIRYTVTSVIINRAWKFDNVTKAAFTVISKYDLNADPIVFEPVSIKKTKTFGVISSSKFLTVNLSLPVRGYVPGQLIPIKINLNNESGVEVHAIKLKLIMHSKYTAGLLRRIEQQFNTTIIKVYKNEIKDVFSLYYEFQVPPLPPSNISLTCDIISIKYAIELEAKFGKIFKRSLKISAPIEIGTIPLINQCQTLLLPSVYLKNSPTYKESMFTVENIQEEKEEEEKEEFSSSILGLEKHFAPRYPFYNLLSSH